MFNRIRHPFGGTPPVRRRTQPTRARLRVEAFEDRLVPSAVQTALLPGASFQGSASGRTMAASDVGTYARVSENGGGITVQLFNSGGALLRTATVAGTS